MTGKYEEPTFSRDSRDADILESVKSALEAQGVKGVRGIGPVNEEGTHCVVLLEDKKNTELNNVVEVRLSNDDRLKIALVVGQDKGSAQLYMGFSPPPWQYSGRLMGGDPIWNEDAGQWGTITFAVSATSNITLEGIACANQSISCNHVLNVGAGSDVSTTNFPNTMKLAWHTNPPSPAGHWVDIGGAEFIVDVPFSHMKLHGLGKITGVKQPQTGIRVSKYGAVSGLTSGRDLGMALRIIDYKNHPKDFFLIRIVSGYFGTVGDSGSAVVDADRNLVGILVAGNPGHRDETYYIQAVPRGQISPNPKLSIFVIDGL